FGTSNDDEFLKDATGNRRFWPVDVGMYVAKKSIWIDLPQEVDQIWAEAYCYWMLGEPLYLSKELEALAAEQQESHREKSDKEGAIIDFLEKEIPSNWDHLSIQSRRMFLAGNQQLGDGIKLVKRQKVCVAEIWTEHFGGDMKYLKGPESREINNILTNVKGWQKMRSPRKFGPHGSQRGFERTNKSPDYTSK
ncbi:MAG: VapE domain-containing protein, partial [Lachnospiraceae bacterium]